MRGYCYKKTAEKNVRLKDICSIVNLVVAGVDAVQFRLHVLGLEDEVEGEGGGEDDEQDGAQSVHDSAQVLPVSDDGVTASVPLLVVHDALTQLLQLGQLCYHLVEPATHARQRNGVVVAFYNNIPTRIKKEWILMEKMVQYLLKTNLKNQFKIDANHNFSNLYQFLGNLN